MPKEMTGSCKHKYPTGKTPGAKARTEHLSAGDQAQI